LLNELESLPNAVDLGDAVLVVPGVVVVSQAVLVLGRLHLN
jgi:hypothetical protein